MRTRALATAVTGSLAFTACSIHISDQTASAVPRNATGVYEITATVTPSGRTVDVLGVTAMVDGAPFPLSPGSGNTWTGFVGITPCKNGFGLAYQAQWDAPLGGGTEVEPAAGVLQKWVTGEPPATCPVTFGRTFTVNSQQDLPDSNPGDGECEATANSCTLRAAIMEANASAGADRILVAAGTYELDRSGDDDTARNGDLDILESVTIERSGSGFVSIDAATMQDRVFDIFAGAEDAVVTLRGMTLRNGRSTGRGGGIYNRAVLFLETMRIEDNRSGNDQAGGGIFTAGPLFTHETRIRGNRAGHFGGGIAIAETASTVLVRSAITDNVNQTQHGGGIAILGGTLEAINVTISGNRSSVHGGGVWANSGSQATFSNVTIARNRSDSDGSGGGDGGGVLLAYSEREYRFGNTIVAENFKGTGTTANDCDANVYSLGHNLIGETSDCTIGGLSDGDLTGTGRARLGNLGFSGGFTRVHRLLPDSEAREAGSSATPNDASLLACRETDQRGEPRPGGSGSETVCDIGAVEMQ